METRASTFNGRMVFGLAMLTLGALWTLDNLGVVEADTVLRWWPSLLIAYGVTTAVGLGRRRNMFWGSFIGAAGALLLLGNLGYARAGFDVVWPLFLIAIGIKVLTRAAGSRPVAGVLADDDRVIQAFAAMGGVTRRSQSKALERVDVSAVMGGVELDLRDATPANGRVVADVFAIWGGIVILVPDTWRVESETSVVMGALQDETHYSNPPQPAGTLVLRGSIIMGAIEVRNDSTANLRGVHVGVTRMRRGATTVTVSRGDVGDTGHEGDSGRGE